MLGSENGFDNIPIWTLQGMDNVTSITLMIENEGTFYFKRDNDNNFYYKLANEDDFLVIDLEVYREKIQSMLIDNNNDFALYKEVVEEKLSFRGLSYLNFIDHQI